MELAERPISHEGVTLFQPEDLFGKERDACGIGAVINRLGEANRTVVDLVLEGLCDLDLRGGQVEKTGDGAGVMFRTAGLRKFLERFIPLGTNVPRRQEIYLGNFFIPQNEALNLPVVLDEIASILGEKGFHIVGRRTSEHFTAPHDTLSIDSQGLGARGLAALPIFTQVLFTNEFNRDESVVYALHQAKLQLSSELKSVYTVSLEKGTVTYKHMATGAQLQRLFQADFQDPKFVSTAGAFHTRFATNVLSRPELAQPFRRSLHNGEVDTVRAMRAATRDLERSLRMSHSVLMREGSDSGDLDRMVSLFYAHGVPLSETLRRMFQPTVDDIALMPQELQMYHRAVRHALGPLSAAEGPAGIIAMDSQELVMILDGLGLRPLRAIETSDGLLIITSEIGAPHIPLEKIERTFQFDAGKIMMVRKDGTVLYPGEADECIVDQTELNYRQLAESTGKMIVLPSARALEWKEAKQALIRKWNAFGGNDDLLQLMKVMAKEGKEPVIGMGNDQPPAVFSRGRPRLARYFHQIVAVVTNPPIDPIREGASMDLRTYLGRRPKAHQHGHRYEPQKHIELDYPILSEEQFQNLIDPEDKNQSLRVHRISTAVRGKTEADMRKRIDQIKRDIVKIARQKKHPVIILSDRDLREGGLYIPPALVIAAIHEELIRLGLRRHVSLICDTGEAFEAHDIALLVAMGADAVNPYLMWQAIESGLISVNGMDPKILRENLMKNYGAMLKRIMSKMGITSLEGYRGSKLMEAVGIDPSVIQFFMKCPVANIGGCTLPDMVNDILERSKATQEIAENPDKGAYDRPIQKILEKVMYGDHQDPVAAYKAYIALVKEYEEKYPVYLRDLLKLVSPNGEIDINEVISEQELFGKHIRGTAMSHGALQLTAHRAIAGALNELGGMSNSGEGGELRERNKGEIWENDRSKIRQFASARFGANAEYLVNAEEIEIKIGQGAKPGEGGHLSYSKVGPVIAKMRHTQVGIDLISPPTQHDMYSIEDLARLIQDLRAVNPKARIAVKITANTDIGTVAVGVAKAGADVIGLSGWEGGTGAAVSSAIEHTGLPLELSLAEVHQALTRNGIRDLVKIRVDGGIKCGEDIVKLGCLGADEFGLGTVLLVAGERCIFCHSCSGQAQGVMSGTFKECPTGIMTVTPTGAMKLGMGAGKVREEDLPDEEKSYHICKASTKHFLKLLAEDVREILARLGKRSIDEIVGDTTLLRQVERTAEANRVRLDALLRDMRHEIVENRSRAISETIDRALTKPAVNVANQNLVDEITRQIREAESEGRELDQIEVKVTLKTQDRSFGATLAGKIASGEIKVPKEGIHVKIEGYAGQSFAFCNIAGVTYELDGFANDFVAMCQSGGMVVIRPPKKEYKHANSVAGNAGAYGASGGKVFVTGKVGQRWGVRNCGAILVSEGTGKFPYEYQTGGIGVDLFGVGNQACSGMTGGRNFLCDDNRTLQQQLHPDAMITNWTKRDRAFLRQIVEEYHGVTKSSLARTKLTQIGWGNDNFRRVVPRDHYINAVTSVLSYDFFRLPDASPFEEVLNDASIEIMAHLGVDEEDPRFPRVREMIGKAKEEFEGKLREEAEAEARTRLQLKADQPLPDGMKLKFPEPPYRFQQAKDFARKFVQELRL